MPAAHTMAAMVAARADGMVVLRRQTQVSPPLYVDALVPAVIRSLVGSDRLTDGLSEGRRSVVVALAHLDAAGWPVPIRTGDLVVLNPDRAPGGAVVDGTGTTLRVLDPGPRGGVGFWLLAEGVV